MQKHIAVVEDEPSLRANYIDLLERQGYKTSAYSTRSSAAAAFSQQLPDMVLIDIGLNDEPDGGFDLCRELRQRSATLPLIFLTARDSDIDTVSGLRLGADDYLIKDISSHHLLARITALFRRLDAMTSTQTTDTSYQRGALSIDPSRMLATWQQQPIDLTVTEFWLLHTLTQHPGHVKNRDQLMDEANIVVDDATITSHIKRIRRKFQKADSSFDRIDTVYGMGYRWKAD